MTKGIEFVFNYLPKILDGDRVCQGCRDRSKCAECGFVSNDENGKEVSEPDKT